MIIEQNNDVIVHAEGPSIRHLRAIGKLVVAFNKLDEYITTLISVLLGAEPELGGIVANSLQGNLRLEVLQNIFGYRLGFADKIRNGIDVKKDQEYLELKRLFQGLKKVTEIRNVVVHSNWSENFADISTAHRLKWKRNVIPGWSDKDYTLENVTDLESKIKSIEKVSNDLGNFVSINFSDYLNRLAKQLNAVDD